MIFFYAFSAKQIIDIFYAKKKKNYEISYRSGILKNKILWLYTV